MRYIVFFYYCLLPIAYCLLPLALHCSLLPTPCSLKTCIPHLI
ncbi:hypothetical protein [Moorena sp. SIO3H5]|nr:hypothetical protein [Moorena sp. SIO3H5]